MPRLLVIRLSAMGDVAMMVPVLQQVIERYPDLEIDLLTRPQFLALFPPIDRLNFIEIDIKNRHKGLVGLYRLFKYLKNKEYTMLLDLHDVLRSQILRTLFSFSGIPVLKINKGRAQKKALIRKDNKIIAKLTSTHVRYANVFQKAGFPIALKIDQAQRKLNSKRIGIAPYAAYKQKMWSIEKIKLLIDRIVSETDFEVYLFGGGPLEIISIDEIAHQSARIISTATYTLEKQIEVMSTLRVMVSMDSANMHLASNLNIPVVSIWGATHPCAGFMGFGQDRANVVQREDLSCRPCSIYGNKKCWRGDWACLEIEVDQVWNHLTKYIQLHD